MMSRWRLFSACVLLLSVSALAQVQEDGSKETTPARGVTAAEYRQHIERLKSLVASCRRDATTCDAGQIGEDERVDGAGFQTRWSWLRETISEAKKTAEPDREKLLGEAGRRLTEDAEFADQSAPNGETMFARGRKGADEILSRPEFRTVTEQSFWDRAIAKFGQWVSEIFSGVSRLGRRSPWLAPLLEWSAITLVCAGVLTWVFRTMQRQRLAVRRESGSVPEMWQKESDNWAELARAEAERQDWRAAVHCLYWAAIVMMEGRRLWRQNRARTPREYVMLLEPDSGMQQTLRGLTQLFERIWYGLRPAAESDYTRALTLFEELRSA